ncbi:MAG: hypothetical protein Q7T21_09625 [Gallionella sp.]|nr:hypothetical protein [Gallionella sp.]
MPNATVRQYFDKSDFDLLLSAISLMPELELVAYAGKLARSQLSYPVETASEFLALFGDAKALRYFDREITSTQASRFMPKEFFPISDEKDLLRKLLLAFQHGSITHAAEATTKRARTKAKTESASDFLIPSPAHG